MRVVITGATGFTGRALVGRLAREDHQLVALSRRFEQVSALLGEGVQGVDLSDQEAVCRALEGADALVNLAGANVAEGRWTEARKQELWKSRVDLTDRLVHAFSSTDRPPSVVVSGSAVGIYGDTGEKVATESSPATEDFLASLCVSWEAAAAQFRQAGARVVCLRMGVVLAEEGGALGKMLPLYRRRLGGVLGSGRQWMSWIHRDDLVSLILASLHGDQYRGALNAVAPEPVRNCDFNKALAASLGVSAVFSVPGFALRVGMGGGASMLLGSSRVSSEHLEGLGFVFSYPSLASALAQILEGDQRD